MQINKIQYIRYHPTKQNTKSIIQLKNTFVIRQLNKIYWGIIQLNKYIGYHPTKQNILGYHPAKQNTLDAKQQKLNTFRIIQLNNRHALRIKKLNTIH